MVEKQNRPRQMRRAVFCHHGSDTVQNSPVSSGVNGCVCIARKEPCASGFDILVIIAIEIAACTRMF
jgi:hypothetical protein